MNDIAEYAPDARRQLFIADLLVLSAGLLLALGIHRPLGIAPGLDGDAFTAHAWLLLVFGIITLLRLGLSGQYESGVRFSRIDDLLVVARTTFLGAATAVFVAVATKGFFLDFETYSRAFAMLGFAVPAVLLAVSRLIGHTLQVRAFSEGRYLARTLVIGGGPRADRLLAWLQSHPHLGLLGRLSGADDSADLASYMRQLTDELNSFEPDELILTFDHPREDLRAAIVREASSRSIAVKVVPGVFENYYNMPFPRYEGVPVATIYESPRDRFGRRIKHAVDRLAALVLLLLLLPLFIVVAALIWLDDRGPIIFAQERVGERGRPFRVMKFRTMRVDAEAQLEALQAQNEAEGPLFKMRDDPRITRVGRVLRRTSFDEFPQLWNVVFREMSLVGPRPPLADEVDDYRPEHRRRLMVRPGMTGLWQVSGRSETTFDEMVELDLQYIERWSFWLDLKILLRTVAVVLSRKGAY